MRFSLKAKILGAYAIILVLVGAVLLFNIRQLDQTTRKLSFLQSVYIPTLGKLNRISGMSHLSNNLSFDQLQTSKSMYHVIAKLNPSIFEQELNSVINASDTWVSKNFAGSRDPLWKRIRAQLTVITTTHARYIQLLQNTTAGASDEHLIEQARLQTVAILQNTSKNLSDSIRNQIQVTIKQERRGLVTTIVLSAITLLISLLVAWILVASLRPIDSLKESITRYAKGEFNVRSRINTRDEISDLAHEFNVMADSIEQRDKTIVDQQSQLRASERMTLVGMMASRISHEIRNPLNAMSLNLELLAEKIPADQREKLNMVSAQVERLNQIVMNYLSLAKNPVQAPLSSTDIRELSLNLHAYLEPECKQLGIQMELEIPAHPVVITGSKYEWEQILLNLCKNAMEALVKGQRFGIKILEESQKMLIWDEGSGISADNLSHMHEPFFTTKTAGTGLGLSITRELLKKLSSRMDVSSQEQLGTTVTLALPVLSKT